MFLRTQVLSEKKLIGKSKRMSFVNNTTRDLWQWFQSKRATLKNVVGNDLYSLEVYDGPDHFRNFDPTREFSKWAAVEVGNYDDVPGDMEKLIIPKGLYAVFLHKGPASEGKNTYMYIFQTWLPSSEFALDDRPHFAVMGAKYKGDSAESEEEIWIPVVKK